MSQCCIMQQPCYHIVLDTEATGLSPYKAKILSLAACIVMVEPRAPCKIVSRFYTYIHSGSNVVIPRVVTRITGIQASDVEHAPSFSNAWSAFETWVETNCAQSWTRVIAAHNGGGYDFRLLAWELARNLYDTTPPRAWSRVARRLCLSRTFDTLLYARTLPKHVIAPSTKCTLGDLYMWHVNNGRPLHNAHDALADVEATVSVFYVSALSCWRQWQSFASCKGWLTTKQFVAKLYTASSKYSWSVTSWKRRTPRVVIANCAPKGRSIALFFNGDLKSCTRCSRCDVCYSTHFSHICKVARPTTDET